ncbi:MAG: aa3-type cytochrome c oxidase subunit IV [Alphaproteobacteria bacterium]|nr:aa3-type cytochrome c oxidase subunit IV [Alphaproteobacteria bacterium]
MASHAEPSRAPVETPPPHTDAYMDMAARRSMWKAFGVNIQWQSMLILIVVGYATFTITMGVPWIGAMIGFAAFGIIGGLLMNMGGAWVATVIGLCVLGIIVQALIWLGSALI